MSGPLYEVFARALRGLSAAKITRPGTYKNASHEGHAVRCSYKVRHARLLLLLIILRHRLCRRGTPPAGPNARVCGRGGLVSRLFPAVDSPPARERRRARS